MLHKESANSIFVKSTRIAVKNDDFEKVITANKRHNGTIFNFRSFWLEAAYADDRSSTIIPNRLFANRKGNRRLPAWLTWVHEYMHTYCEFGSWRDTDGNRHYGWSQHNRDWSLGDYRDRFEEYWRSAQRRADNEYALEVLEGIRDDFDVFWGLKVESFNYEDACDLMWD